MIFGLFSRFRAKGFSPLDKSLEGVYNRGVKLTELNRKQQEEASPRWRLILELSRTMTPTEIGKKLGLSRSRASQLINHAREYFENDEKS